MRRTHLLGGNPGSFQEFSGEAMRRARCRAPFSALRTQALLLRARLRGGGAGGPALGRARGAQDPSGQGGRAARGAAARAAALPLPPRPHEAAQRVEMGARQLGMAAAPSRRLAPVACLGCLSWMVRRRGTVRHTHARAHAHTHTRTHTPAGALRRGGALAAVVVPRLPRGVARRLRAGGRLAVRRRGCGGRAAAGR